jgi:hypothetical protein
VLTYFEDLLNYNESIKLINNPYYFERRNLDYSKNPEHLLNSEVLRIAIKNQENAFAIVPHLAAAESNSKSYKLQKLLQHIIDIIHVKESDQKGEIIKLVKNGGEKRPFDEMSDNDEILNIAIFIEHSIDIFINKIEEYVNLYLYCDFEYINEKVYDVFLKYSAYFKDNIYEIIKNKIILYLNNEKTYKNEDYGKDIKVIYEEHVLKLLTDIAKYINNTSDYTVEPSNRSRVLTDNVEAVADLRAMAAVIVLVNNNKDEVADVVARRVGVARVGAVDAVIIEVKSEMVNKAKEHKDGNLNTKIP